MIFIFFHQIFLLRCCFCCQLLCCSRYFSMSCYLDAVLVVANLTSPR